MAKSQNSVRYKWDGGVSTDTIATSLEAAHGMPGVESVEMTVNVKGNLSLDAVASILAVADEHEAESGVTMVVRVTNANQLRLWPMQANFRNMA